MKWVATHHPFTPPPHSQYVIIFTVVQTGNHEIQIVSCFSKFYFLYNFLLKSYKASRGHKILTYNAKPERTFSNPNQEAFEDFFEDLSPVSVSVEK